MRSVCFIFNFLVFLSLIAQAQEPGRVPSKDIRTVISSEAYVRAGLGKLSERELQELSGALFGWEVPVLVAKRPADRVPVPQVEAKQSQEFGKESIPVQKKSKSEKERITSEIQSQIVGEFRGWDGQTVFKLSNGQIWKQVDRSKFYLKADDPTVLVEKGFLGAYFLSVDGFGARCKVKRLK